MRFFDRKAVEKVLLTQMNTQQKNGLNAVFKPFFGWQGQKDLNPRHAVLERQTEFVISYYSLFFVSV